MEFRFTCGLRNGMHARPASLVSEVARRFSAPVTIGRIGAAGVDARSVLSIVGLDVKFGDECVVVADGADAAEVATAFKELVETRLAHADEIEPLEPGSTPDVRLPPGLRSLGIAHAGGRAVSGGFGEGVAAIVEGLRLPPGYAETTSDPPEAELKKARRAVDDVRADLIKKADGARGMERELLHAHADMAADPALWREIEESVSAGSSAARALVSAAERFSDRLRNATSQYIRDRVVDVQDVAMQILHRLVEGGVPSMNVRLEAESVVFAETLTANQFLQMDRRLLKGLVLGHVGATSHTVILARSHRIPTIIDVPNPGSLVKTGTSVVVDGDGGFVATEIGDAVRRYYQRERAVRERWLARLGTHAQQPAITSDGVRLEVAANAATPEEVIAAMSGGADGVGLMRTELLFLDRTTAPGEQEQFERYATVVKAAAGRPVIIRTFDIGGDKPAAYLDMPVEENPFLGVRGLRLYPRHEGMLATQLRAIVRASALGPVRVMAPMVATPEEAAWFRGEVQRAQESLEREGAAFDRAMPVGIMVEIPAVAFALEHIARHADFFSIGTNDLCQYWMAVDRGNAGVAPLYNARQPSFLRLLKAIVDGARSCGRWIGMCGEMAGDRTNLPLLVGLGLDEISVSPGEVLAIKSAVRDADAGRCRGLLERALTCRSATDVEALLKQEPCRRPGTAPLIERDLIAVGSDARTKEEAIKEAVDLLLVAGRTERPRDVEEAVFAREATYSTGFGNGFAVPHGKSDAVSEPALAVVKLREPVEWGSLDGAPVGVLILLVVPVSEAAGGGGAGHMAIFQKLARKLMHEEFRNRLIGALDPGAIEACMKEELGIG